MALPWAGYTTENTAVACGWVSLDLIDAEQTGGTVGGAGKAVSVEVHRQKADDRQPVAGVEG